MPDRLPRLRFIVWLTALIAFGAVLAVALVAALAMYVWAHAVPPLEAEPTRAGLRVQVNRAMLRDVEIAVDSCAPVMHAELPRGVTVLPWSEFGLTTSPTLHDEVREVRATGMSRFSRFETTISYSPETAAGQVAVSTISQTFDYVSAAE